jgi:hypothetical protein
VAPTLSVFSIIDGEATLKNAWALSMGSSLKV